MKKLSILLSLIVLVSCQKKAQELLESENTTLKEAVDASMDGADVAIGDDSSAEASRSLFGQRNALRFFSLRQSAFKCVMKNLIPSLGSPNCQGTEEDKTVLSKFEGCQAHLRGISADVKFSFDAPNTCDKWIGGTELPVSGSLTTTANYIKIETARPWEIVATSNATKNYLGEEISGGVVTTFGENTRSFDVKGYNVKASHKQGKQYDRSLRTLEPLVVTGRRVNGDMKLVSGKIQIDHNIAEFSVISTYKDLKWDDSCCYPTGGSIEKELKGEKEKKITSEFVAGSCGLVKITVDKGSDHREGQLQLEACGE